jgi:aspartate/glutamate racemase
MRTLAIIHTTPATVDSLKTLANDLIPGWELLHIVDESVLPQLARNGGNLSEVEDRLLIYARAAEQAGAEILLEACSSVGELVEKMRRLVSIPVVRIDEAMAELAVQRAERIGVAATLPTTLAPTRRLLEEQARAARKQVTLESKLIEGAFEKLSAGDRAGHDALLIQGLSDLAQTVDVVVLAQASMARVIPQLPVGEQEKFLTSPRSAMQRVQAISAKI